MFTTIIEIYINIFDFCMILGLLHDAADFRSVV